MNKENGNYKSSPIWLLADSEPNNWKDKLKDPLDSRHPARHNILTPVLDIAQDKVFRTICNRIDCSQLYIRNSVDDANLKSKDIKWDSRLQEFVQSFGNDIAKYRPVMILTFGSFAFEFARRSAGEPVLHKYTDWNTTELGKEFCMRTHSLELTRPNILPLLHVSIARGRFLESHRNFCNSSNGKYDNYFEYVGESIAKILITNKNSLDIWINKVAN